jgi:hypothetical protein
VAATAVRREYEFFILSSDAHAASLTVSFPWQTY